MPASLDDDGWELESAVERHRQYPNKFEIPSEEERTSLQPSDMVKLLFLFLTNDEAEPIIQCERMWVTVQEIAETNYVGMLESPPVSSDVFDP